jgi:hypothetical protein
MKDQIANILDRVRKWPEERQADAAELLKLIEDHDTNPHRLTDEQAAEVRRRLAKPSSKTLTLTQLDERVLLQRLGQDMMILNGRRFRPPTGTGPR